MEMLKITNTLKTYNKCWKNMRVHVKRKIKYLSWITIPGMDRWEILIPSQIYNANSSKKVA